MIACPLLLPGTHWTETARWPLLMTAPASTPLPLDAPALDFLTAGQRLAHWDGRRLTILPGYACDGYSPVIRIFGRWLRLTPTPRCGMWPAVLHDLLRQFLPLPACPWTRRDTDNWFYDSLRSGGLSPHHAGIYHGVVAGPLGSPCIRMTRPADPALRIVSADAPPAVRNGVA